MPKPSCTQAVAVTGNHVDEALAWILINEEDEVIESSEAEMGNEEEEESAQDEDETEIGQSTSDLDTDASAESSDKSANEKEIDGGAWIDYTA